MRKCENVKILLVPKLTAGWHKNQSINHSINQSIQKVLTQKRD